PPPQPRHAGTRRRHPPPPPQPRPRHAQKPTAPTRYPPAPFRMSSTPASPRTAAAANGRTADSTRRRHRVLTALNQAAADGVEISVAGIARAAGVDRSFLYRHRDLLEQLHAAGAHPH